MTKAELAEKITLKTGLTKPEAAGVVEAFMDSIKESMIAGENVYLRGFGSFILKQRAEKMGRNIKNNTTVKIPAHKVAAFKPCPKFADAVKYKK